MRQGISGKYVSAVIKEYKGKKGVLLKIDNPFSKVNTLPLEALKEIHAVLDEIRNEADLTFILFHGSGGRIHAGADLSLFAGEINPRAVHEYLTAGTDLDLKIKEISRKVTTVSIMQGERYGGSVEWPLMAHYGVCTPDTGIQFSEVNIGIIPGWNGILNTVLRSGGENALYLAATGNRIHAEEMLRSGLVSRIYPGETILDEALDLAVSGGPPAQAPPEVLVSREDLDRMIAQRTDSRRYRELVREVARKIEMGELEGNGKQGLSASKYINGKLKELGKPIAPRAVAAVFELIEKFPDVTWENGQGIKEMARAEVESCFRLMHTEDRRVGVNSVLTDNPLEKISTFSGNPEDGD